jgi:hypothetical protein
MRSLLLITVFLFTFGNSATAQTDRENVVLEALGGFSALALYNTYIVVGAVADGYVSEVYTQEMATNLIAEQIPSIELLTEHCNKLLAGNVLQNASDKEYVSGIREALKLLQTEASALKDFIASGNESDQKAYDESRNAAWAKISKLLGFEQK